MNSNWNVTYHSGPIRRGPGPFAEFVAASEETNRREAVRAGLPVIDLWPVAATAVNFGPLHPPAEVEISFPLIFGWFSRIIGRVASQDATMTGVLGRAVVGGPKLFRPTSQDCEPLEQIELTFTGSEYRQPFPVCVVEFPADYSAGRILPSPLHGGSIRPSFAAVLAEGGCLVAFLILEERGREPFGDCLPVTASGSTVEDVLKRSADSERPCTFAPFVRAALNYLMICTGNCRDQGPAMPAQERSLRDRHKRAKKAGDRGRAEELREKLKRLPTVHSLDQDVRLFGRVPEDSEPNPAADGSPKRPHWRRGHWRKVAVGEGRSARERRFIRPVLVNDHLLPGRGGSTDAHTAES